MKKKIALILALAMLINCVAWADTDTETEKENEAAGGAIATVALVVLLGGFFVYLVAYGLTSEADAPDDGIRLVSMQNNSPSLPETRFGTALKVLQHVDFGVTADNKTYAGLRFQF
jgi:hypothetical protein